MPDRFTAHDYDAAWQVWDNVEQRSVGGSFTEAGALAEAARLNAMAPKRAKSVVAWAFVDDVGTIMPLWIGLTKNDAYRLQREWIDSGISMKRPPIARVRITEISEDDSHG